EVDRTVGTPTRAEWRITQFADRDRRPTSNRDFFQLAFNRSVESQPEPVRGKERRIGDASSRDQWTRLTLGQLPQVQLLIRVREHNVLSIRGNSDSVASAGPQSTRGGDGELRDCRLRNRRPHLPDRCCGGEPDNEQRRNQTCHEPAPRRRDRWRGWRGGRI